MDVQTNPARHSSALLRSTDSWESRRANHNYGFAPEAHPGESQGRPSTNTRSKRIKRLRPARPAFAPRWPCPNSRTVLTNPDATGIEAVRSHRAHPAPFIPATNLLERSLAEVKRRTKVTGRFPGETSCLTLVFAILDLFLTHASNRATFTALDRQHLYRIKYHQADPDTIDQEVTAAQTHQQEPNRPRIYSSKETRPYARALAGAGKRWSGCSPMVPHDSVENDPTGAANVALERGEPESRPGY
jgi:hypothetical protein